MAGMDYKGAHSVLARVPTCSALTAPAQPAGQSLLALMKPNQLQNQLQGFSKEPCEGRTCWPVCSRVPEHRCPQNDDLGESATTQAQCSKSSHTEESVQNTGTPAFPNVPPCPRQHHCPGNTPGYHSPGSPFHDTQGCPVAAQRAGGTLMCVFNCGSLSWLTAVCKLPRDLAAEGRRQPVPLTSLCWPGRAGQLLWLACSSPVLASKQHTSGFNDPLH